MTYFLQKLLVWMQEVEEKFSDFDPVGTEFNTIKAANDSNNILEAFPVILLLKYFLKIPSEMLV